MSAHKWLSTDVQDTCYDNGDPDQPRFVSDAADLLLCLDAAIKAFERDVEERIAILKLVGELVAERDEAIDEKVLRGRLAG